jgi:hypothetical protein
MTEKLIILLTKAVEQKRPLTYGYIGKELGVKPIIVERLFSECDELFKENGLPPISTIVVNGEKNICGDGYFKEHYPNAKDKDILWINNLKVIFSNKKKVIELLTTKQ